MTKDDIEDRLLQLHEKALEKGNDDFAVEVADVIEDILSHIFKPSHTDLMVPPEGLGKMSIDINKNVLEFILGVTQAVKKLHRGEYIRFGFPPEIYLNDSIIEISLIFNDLDLVVYAVSRTEFINTINMSKYPKKLGSYHGSELVKTLKGNKNGTI